MPKPLDYYGADAKQPTPSASNDLPIAKRQSISTGPSPIPPVDFPAILSRTDDHAAIGAIQSALQRAGIPFHRASTGTPVNRVSYLFVRAADQPQASEIAASILARRNRVRALPRQQIPTDEPDFHMYRWDIHIGD